MTQQLESIVKATQCSDLLISDIRAAHSVACQENPLLEILLRELIADAVRLNRRLAEIESSSPEKIVVVLMIQDEGIAVAVKPGEAFRVTGFSD